MTNTFLMRKNIFWMDKYHTVCLAWVTLEGGDEWLVRAAGLATLLAEPSAASYFQRKTILPVFRQEDFLNVANCR